MIKIDLNKDYDFLKKYYYKNKKSFEGYEDSWSSIIQGIRDNPYMYKKKLFFSKKGDVIILYNHLCDLNKLKKKLDEILNLTKTKKIVYKNVKEKEGKYLEKIGFRNYTNNEKWNSLSKYDDQTYPQVEVNINIFSKLKGKKHKRIRNYYNSFNAKGYSFMEYDKSIFKERCKKLFIFNAKQTNKQNYLENYKSNSIFLDFPPTFSYCIFKGETLVGFIGCDICKDKAFLNCIQAKIDNLGIYILIETMKKLKHKNIKKINLSGSESKSLFEWKLKFSPNKLIKRKHMVYHK